MLVRVEDVGVPLAQGGTSRLGLTIGPWFGLEGR